ncbi:translation elongation factor Ts [Candidatus Parcubacteria bacterium]|nr:translation elongation factor Ts [Candidatus Parcubacteria bacterium]
MDIGIEQIKALRDRTGLSVAEVKKALTEAGGDEAKAIALLKERGGAIADKKSSRELGAGIVEAYVHSTRRVGCMMELMCETDFVARNQDFQTLAHDIAMHVAAMKPANVEDLLAQPFIKDPEQTIKDLITQYIAKLGENIQIGRFELFEI